MARFCASCGTEVDDSAVFCPTCGQPIDQEVQSGIPPAPAWPDPSEVGTGASREADAGEPTRPIPAPASDDRAFDRVEAPPPSEPQIRPTAERRYEPPAEATAPGHRPPPPEADVSAERRAAPRPAAPPPASPAGSGDAGSSPLSSLPVTTPVTLSGWLIGVGTALGAVGALISLFDGRGAAVDLLLAILLAAVALSVFFASSVPSFAHLRLATLAVVLVAFGAGADRLLAGFAGAGELLLFLGTAAAVIGVLLLELGRDQPMGREQP